MHLRTTVPVRDLFATPRRQQDSVAAARDFLHTGSADVGPYRHLRGVRGEADGDGASPSSNDARFCLRLRETFSTLRAAAWHIVAAALVVAGAEEILATNQIGGVVVLAISAAFFAGCPRGSLPLRRPMLFKSHLVCFLIFSRAQVLPLSLSDAVKIPLGAVLFVALSVGDGVFDLPPACGPIWYIVLRLLLAAAVGVPCSDGGM